MDVEIEHPHHHEPTGHGWLDKLVPLSALLISIVSIAIALHHGTVMESLVEQNERLVQANSLPYMEIQKSDSTPEGQPRISAFVTNSGVGPAQIRSVQIKVDGRPVVNIPTMFAACCGSLGDTKIITSTLLDRMLPAGQELRYVDMQGPAAKTPAAQSFFRALSKRIVTTICYCSVFEECWLTASSGMSKPKRVNSCPVPEPQYRY